jgi:hypothetical protein
MTLPYCPPGKLRLIGVGAVAAGIALVFEDWQPPELASAVAMLLLPAALCTWFGDVSRSRRRALGATGRR